MNTLLSIWDHIKQWRAGTPKGPNLKAREDYLLKHQDILIDKLSNSLKSLNRDIIACYTLLFVFLLFHYGLLKEAAIEGNKLNISQQQALIIFPLFTCIPYILINNTIQLLARIIYSLKSNSAEIMAINKDARPFDIADLDLYMDGVTGLQLRFARLIVRYAIVQPRLDLDLSLPQNQGKWQDLFFKVSRPFKIYNSLRSFSGGLSYLLAWFFCLTLIYILPLLLPALMIFKNEVSPLIDHFKFPDSFGNRFFLEFIVLLIVMGYTLLSNLFLYSFYFKELTDMKDALVQNVSQTTSVLSGWFLKRFKKKTP